MATVTSALAADHATEVNRVTTDFNAKITTLSAKLAHTEAQLVDARYQGFASDRDSDGDSEGDGGMIVR